MINRRLVAAAAASSFLVAVAGLHIRKRWAETLQTIVLFPGFGFSAIFWPAGIHSDYFTGPIGARLMIGTIFLSSMLFWTGVIYGCFRLFRRRSTAVNGEAK